MNPLFIKITVLKVPKSKNKTLGLSWQATALGRSTPITGHMPAVFVTNNGVNRSRR